MTGWTLVTGGAKRLGADICNELSLAGHRVLTHYRKTPVADGEFIQGDFSTPRSVDEFLERLQKYEIHYLVNNVGNYETDSALNSSMEVWRSLYQTNFFAPLAIIRSLAPQLKAVVNIGTAGMNHFSGETYASPYHFSKHSLYCLTMSLAKELAEKGVRVNMVSPGVLDNSIDKSNRQMPMGREGRTEEVARAVRYLLGEEYITGQNLDVAGGWKL